MHNIIINADDFGKSKEITSAILSAMDLNLCLDTTLLVNFEDSFHAASLAIDTNKKNNIGIHLNLTEGTPLTDKIKKEKRFCNEDGLFHLNKNERIICLTSSEKSAVYDELTSQIHLCRKYGIPISHADSHNHIHEEPGLLFIFLNIMKKEKIPFLRITKNIGKTSFSNKVYRDSYNSVLSFSHLAGTTHFGSTTDFMISPPSKKKNSITELMIHPGAIRNDQIIDTYSNDNLSLKLPEILKGNNLISYSHLKR
jgi:chitin disaccharide deacetylase